MWYLIGVIRNLNTPNSIGHVLLYSRPSAALSNKHLKEGFLTSLSVKPLLLLTPCDWFYNNSWKPDASQKTPNPLVKDHIQSYQIIIISFSLSSKKISDKINHWWRTRICPSDPGKGVVLGRGKNGEQVNSSIHFLLSIISDHLTLFTVSSYFHALLL